ncbi:2,3-bisphosphoglycerate-independent phosphoglycerate mutase [uncultured Dubosiella sp.]|jgi:2,3-bisphosphoglycerate-independent phosphoglycerate mutase|uniref:2,3-bisphosphoglycerate-independent phosphoglycerate mutase n=2 Tax=uncultured Dubosiella sp. TaxID=1937011 RepID=UPI002087BB6D|nr:2,3-bisphosphoglycerate-independent phosphoglycerate mutase [uncultured Dubosiella sp.]GJM57915.1 putative 2,3-bisphosphoglycerate-independent phosphoglycerate mutase [Erysipelotrichaceae bacterium OPF54]
MEKRPVVLVVMDGVGLSDKTLGNAVKMAYKPTLDKLWNECPHTELRAHGLAVGLPTDSDMGNSEVGHNAIGCGQIYSQGAKLVNENIDTKELFNSTTWKELVEGAKDHTMHFIGLLSDGNVHSHIRHLEALIKEAKEEGVKKVRVHALLDGRDVPETSALQYVDEIENFMNDLNDDTFDARIASGGGRMQITMDRYEANWPMVEEGWNIHVHGQGRQFASATEAIETYRKESGVVDQDLPGFVIAADGEPVGKIEDGDSVILFNFRGDRAQEICRAFDEGDEFDKFDRGNKPDVNFAGMLQYDADLNIPKKYLTEPPKIRYTLTEELVNAGVNEYAISETQKFGHVTYFWNGNRSEKFDDELETYVEVQSDVIPFEQRPWMKSAEITDQFIEAIESGKYGFLRTNYPNGDMVGHTGNLEATVIGVEAVDLALARVIKAVDKVNGILLITADHGNADEMYDKPKADEKVHKAKTSHTLNKVPFIVYGADVKLKQDDNLGLSNIAATVCDLLEIKPNEHWNESIIEK